ncbi:sugar phosphate isomerase/epimerase [Microbacterium sp. MYb64]|uniref:sugar phosphate isomerase/epimerase family protein n=1 Tax=Microbacterium sp. MYb64 TaxID=1848691 RepID=UPI000CFD9DB6|nr:sugar phosphate isomerase/epimerase [Microbacterium sp. MYb64]PRB07514.1 sugar phosphate isomerase [Microbacterium sp. MYb64]
MKLGLMTACLPNWSLERLAEHASARGFDALEVAAWPSVGSRDFEATHIDAASFDSGKEDAVREILLRTGVSVSALGYYENNLHHDPDRRAAVHAHLRQVVDVASRLGVPYVGTFVGRDNALSIVENMAEGERVLPALVDYAGERGVRLITENCVMEGWHPDGYPGNIAYSPEVWEWATTLGFGLNWDPSHLTWIGIDPLTTILPFAAHIVHAQAKDAETSPEARNRTGFYGTVHKGGNPWEMGWWRYRIPGRGDVDWTRVVDRLYAAGFTGTLSVEHEDPFWSGSDEAVLEGLQIAYDTLRPLVRRERAGVGVSPSGTTPPAR